MIKVVAFDIGNTIYIIDKRNTILKNLINIFDLPKEKVRNSYYNIFNKNNYSLEKLTKMLCEDLNSSKYNEVLKYFQNLDIESKKYDYVDENILDLIKDLKKIGIKIILSSNSNILHKNLTDKNLEGLIDFTFRTYQIGYQKSEESYYRHIEKQLNVKSNEILNIGDDFILDYEMPKKFGWHAILFNNNRNSIYNANDLKCELINYITF